MRDVSLEQFSSWRDIVSVAVLLVFAFVLWRLAVWRLQLRLID